MNDVNSFNKQHTDNIICIRKGSFPYKETPFDPRFHASQLSYALGDEGFFGTFDLFGEREHAGGELL